MEHQSEHQPEQTDRNEFLARYFADAFEKPNEIKGYRSLTASWVTTVSLHTNGDRIVSLSRIAENGDIDAFGINLDDPEDSDAHMAVEGGLWVHAGGKQIAVQEKLGKQAPGVLVPTTDKMALLEEFIDELRMYEEIDTIFK